MHALRIRSDRTWTFPMAPDELWARLCETGSYATWWPWLTEFDAPAGLVAGARWRCRVSPPVPYDLSFALHLAHVSPCRQVVAEVAGDIRGEALLTLRAARDGCVAQLRSELRPANPVLCGVALVARPVVERGHDWVLDTGSRQFHRAIGTDRPGA